jgi:transcriptional regulator with XRE-family HTH domain
MNSKDVENMAAAVNVRFGRRLARVRKVRDLSQSELGSRVGVSRTTIANLESGKQNVQLHQIFALARALDTPIEELIPTRKELGPDLADLVDKDQMFVAMAKRHLSNMLRDPVDE